MNSNGLARYYDGLSPWERLPLLVSAAARSDDVEYDRLARSVPKLCFRVPNYWGLTEGFNNLAKLHVLAQLDLAVIYGRVEAFLEQQVLLGDNSNEARQREERLWKLAQTLAYRFVVRAEGWKLLCAELHIDPDVLLRDLPGYKSIRETEEMARLTVCTPEQAIAYLQEAAERDELEPCEAPAVRLDTAEDVARSMRKFLDENLDSWS